MRSDSQLITLTVTLRNKAGNFIMGVPRESFHLFDEKDEQPIQFVNNSDTPMSVGILVDTSESMQLYDVKDLARPGPLSEAIARFIELSNNDNEYFLVSFDTTPRLVADWSTGRQLLSGKTTLEYRRKNTALYDACFTAIEKLQSAHSAKKAILLFTDGQDNSSHHTFKELRELLRRSDISLYAIGVGNKAYLGSTLGLEGQGILDELTESTGGHALYPQDNKKLREVAEFLSIELRHQYRIGFSPGKSTTAGKWHRVKLTITPRANAPEEFSKLTVQTRSGYYSH